MQVFLVEDSPLVLERLTSMIGAVPGAAVAGHAGSAAATIAAILASRPDVVILDLKLAEGSGYDVLRALHERAPEIDVYMLSNFAAEPYRRHAERLGARGFFDKSKDIGRVRELLAQRAAQPQ
jgi:DNA-binding NarL/FixJ family response regulator